MALAHTNDSGNFNPDNAAHRNASQMAERANRAEDREINSQNRMLKGAALASAATLALIFGGDVYDKVAHNNLPDVDVIDGVAPNEEECIPVNTSFSSLGYARGKLGAAEIDVAHTRFDMQELDIETGVLCVRSSVEGLDDLNFDLYGTSAITD